MSDIQHRKGFLDLFDITMMNLVAIVILAYMPTIAQLRFSLLFFYLIGGICFLGAASLFCAELGSTWPMTGGLYVWVREAFGKRWAMTAIWSNWLYNVVWYPAILALIVTGLITLFKPELTGNKPFMAFSISALYWILTALNMRGLKTSSFISIFCTIFGIFLPISIIILLTITWLIDGRPSEIVFSWKDFFPSGFSRKELYLINALIFTMFGSEMVGTHAKEMRNPSRDYPRSLLITFFVALISLVGGALAIAIVIPAGQLAPITGVVEAFELFFYSFDLGWFAPLIAGCVLIGAIGSISTWLLGPTRGLMVASEDGNLPLALSYTNSENIPTKMLVMQAVVVTLLSLLVIFAPGANSLFWILSIVTTQLGLIPYLFIFAAGIALRYKKGDVERPFKIPGGKGVIWALGALGAIPCLFGFCLGFVPPPEVPPLNIWKYELSVVAMLALVGVIPPLLVKRR